MLTLNSMPHQLHGYSTSMIATGWKDTLPTRFGYGSTTFRRTRKSFGLCERYLSLKCDIRGWTFTSFFTMVICRQPILMTWPIGVRPGRLLIIQPSSLASLPFPPGVLRLAHQWAAAPCQPIGIQQCIGWWTHLAYINPLKRSDEPDTNTLSSLRIITR